MSGQSFGSQYASPNSARTYSVVTICSVESPKRRLLPRDVLRGILRAPGNRTCPRIRFSFLRLTANVVPMVQGIILGQVRPWFCQFLNEHRKGVFPGAR